MNHYEEILSDAMGNYGIFTFREALKRGASSSEIHRWIRMGRVIKVGRGVYRMTSYPSMGMISDMAALLADIGPDAYLYGETVLGFLELCPTRPDVAYVAAPSRKRRALGRRVKILRGPIGYQPFYPQGVACQRVGDAIRSAVGSVECDHIAEAIGVAVQRGYLASDDGNALDREILYGKATA